MPESYAGAPRSPRRSTKHTLVKYFPTVGKKGQSTQSIVNIGERCEARDECMPTANLDNDPRGKSALIKDETTFFGSSMPVIQTMQVPNILYYAAMPSYGRCKCSLSKGPARSMGEETGADRNPKQAHNEPKAEYLSITKNSPMVCVCKAMVAPRLMHLWCPQLECALSQWGPTPLPCLQRRMLLTSSSRQAKD